jgi:hypothetical protein
MNSSTNQNKRGIMKLTKLTVTVALAAIGLLVSTGCQTVSTTYTPYIGVPTFPPSDPAQVQILRTEPTRPNIRLGEVKATASSPNEDVTKIENALKKYAAKLGADAAVVVYDRTQVVGATVVGGWLNRSVDPIEGLVVIAIAIKYQ